MSSLFEIGISGLKTQQAALGVVGQNITNASTPGYTRQRADLESVVGGSTLGSGVGAGVNIAQITRIADAFIDEQVRVDVGLHAELEAFSERIGQLQTSLFDGEFGLDIALQAFFDSLQNAANEPADLAAREFALSSADALVQRFRGVADRTQLQEQDVLASLQSSTQRINELSNLLAQVNERVAGLNAEKDTGAKNLLLDQREGLLKELSSLVSVTTLEQENGQVNVFMGKGQPLVLAGSVAEMGVTRGGDITFKNGTTEQIVTSVVRGGKLGGLLKFREDVLSPAQNQLGRLAASLAVAFNAQHALGVDMDGRFGGDFFRDINDPDLVGSRVDYLGGTELSDLAKSASVKVYIDDPFAGEAADYRVLFSETSPGSYSVVRSTDGETVYRGSSFVSPSEIEFDGIRVEFASGSFAPGDAILIRPYATLGEDISVALTDPAAVALSSPVAVSTDPANQGNGRLTIAEIVDADHPIFAVGQDIVPPLLVEFVSATEYRILDNSDPANPQPLDPDIGLQRFNPGSDNHIFPFQPGTTTTSTSGPQLSTFIPGGFVSDFSAPTNGYPPGSLSVSTGDQDTTVVLEQNASAREIAARLAAVPGIGASAHTQIVLSDLVDLQSGTAVELAINGQLIQGFTSLGELADAINANESLAGNGIKATSDGQTLTLESIFGDDLALHFQGDPNESITLTNIKGETHRLRGSVAGSYDSVSIGGSVALLLGPDQTVSAQYPGIMADNPIVARADFGFDAQLTGNVQAGDKFALDFNTGGIADNRNALALAELSDALMIGDPPRTYAGEFGALVQEVGVQASQANINREAAESLLLQSEAFRESVSGVNLDEEASNLIRHEQAYNAAAQIISVARDIFQVLLNSVS